MKDVLESEDVKKIGKYLALLINEEYAYDIVDQIGKAKNMEDFADGLWRAMRLAKKFESEYKNLIPTNENIKNVLNLIGEDNRNLKFLSRYLGSLAFSRWFEIEKLKQEEEETKR